MKNLLTEIKKPHIAVVGAGPVGAAAALLLVKQGFRITLIDRQEPQSGPAGFGMDIRNIALSPSSAALLESIDAWPQDFAARYETMHIWEQWGTNNLTFNAADINESALGWIVQVAPLLSRLWELLRSKQDAAQGLEVVIGQVANISTPNSLTEKVEIALQSRGAEKTVPVDLVIAADGAESAVRKSLNTPATNIPTGQMALTTVVRSEFTHQNTAWQRFLVDGPLAFLPANDPSLCSVVWSQSAAQCARRLALTDDAFCRELERAFENRLGTILAAAPRQGFPLRQQLAATAMPHSKIVFIGDALRVVHPLAGLGVNLGFEDVRLLLKMISNTPAFLAGNSNAGLNRFARQRHLRSEAMLRALDALKRLYALDQPMSSWIRNTGIGIFNSQPWLKRQIMREAMGLASE